MTTFFDRYKNLSQQQLQQCFYASCKNGYLDEVKYLLTSPELKENADIGQHEGDALIFAVDHCQYEVLEYLLNSPELKEHISIHTQHDFAIIKACENGDKDMVKFLLTSPTLKEYSNIHTRGNRSYYSEDRPFLTAYIGDNIEVLEYLIFEYNIPLTDSIKKIIKNDPKEITSIVENMFKMRNLHKELITNLVNNQESKLIQKIKL